MGIFTAAALMMGRRALGGLAPGRVVKLNENGAPVEFYVAHHGYPQAGTPGAASGVGRTLLVRREKYNDARWNANSLNIFETSEIKNWLNSDYLALLDADVQSQIANVDVDMARENGAKVVSMKVFWLSITEFGYLNAYIPPQGARVDAAETILAGLTGTAWTRTSAAGNSVGGYYANAGDIQYGDIDGLRGNFPAFTLPSSLSVDGGGNVIV
jgi:hypothetical protein